jgi:hypothetical protein
VRRVAQQQAVVEKKTLRAPFAGKLGISTVNPGQYMNPADKLVTLQTIDPIYVDFYLPQQQLPQVAIGQTDHPDDGYLQGRAVHRQDQCDQPQDRHQYPQRAGRGHYPQSQAAAAPRHVRQCAGELGEENRYITLPQTAITFNPYGDTVFVVKPSDKKEDKDEKGNPRLLAQQVFVTTGPTRGDQVAILKGIEPGTEVVTSGQVKLKTGTPLIIDNKVQPSNSPIRGRRKNEPAHMNFTDLFIRKPVLAITISLLILVLGVRSLTSLSVRQYPKTQNAVVTISTTYYGADAQTVAGFITQPLEGAIAQAQGIDYMSSTSVSGVSAITATLRLNYDSNRALTEINTQVNSVRNQLPPEAQQPVLTVAGRTDHRCDVHGLLQRGLAQQQRHRLPGPRGQAQARFGRRRADRRDPGRPDLRAACLAGSDAAGGLRRYRDRRAQRAWQQ